MNNTEVLLGETTTVENKKRDFGEADFYYAGYIEFNGRPHGICFTDADIAALIERAERNKGDMPELVKRKSKKY